MSRLRRGDLLPRMVTPPPGPRSRRLSARLGRLEAPGVDTRYGGRPSIQWAEARGANVLDVDGNRYLDLTAGFGVASVGHRHPRVVAAVRRQAGRLLHGLGDVQGHALRAELAARLTKLAPVDEPQVYFAISGSDAVEIALKTALLATGRPGILAFDPAYHGLTLGALHATSRQEFRAPFAALSHPHVRRLPFGCPAADLATALSAEAIGGVIVEPVVGREGVVPPPAGWLAELAALCRRYGALLIADEIFTGLGRTGYWFAVEGEGAEGELRPDLLCCGKALGGGLPIAAVVGRRPLLAAWRSGGEALHTATFLANPLACAAALAVLDVLKDERLVRRSRRMGRLVGDRLAGWAERFGAVTAVRGRGLLWGVELASRRPGARLAGLAAERGVLLLVGGPAGRVAQIVPPLNIARRQLDAALDLLESALPGI